MNELLVSSIIRRSQNHMNVLYWEVLQHDSKTIQPCNTYFSNQASSIPNEFMILVADKCSVEKARAGKLGFF